MKIVHITTGVSRSSACFRIQNALNKQNINSSILALKKSEEKIPNVYVIQGYSVWYKAYEKIAYYLNIAEFVFLKKLCGLKDGMPFTFGIFGINLTKFSIIKDADIIHIHCVNGAFMSLHSFSSLRKLNKPIVITVHDSWILTGGCHVLDGCINFQYMCKNCPQLERYKKLVYRSFKRKRKTLEKLDITFTAPSKWTVSNIEKSMMFNAKKHAVVIANTLNLSVFRIMNSNEIKQLIRPQQNNKIRILFGAANSVSTPYKGFNYLLKMLVYLRAFYPEIASRIELNIFGANCSNEKELEYYDCTFWGYIVSEEKLAALYNYCDLYIVPSLEDSFNQTVLESSACGTPVVSFSTGGIVDIIIHEQTGYLAKYKNSEDLAQGIIWMLENNIENQIGINARRYVEDKFSEERIGKAFKHLYESILYK